jgi:hypothetical protein
MALDSVAGTAITLQVAMSAGKNKTGTTYGQITNNSTITKKFSYTLGGNVALGVNEIYSSITSISSSSNTTLDLTALTDLINVASINMARVKAIVIQLLSATDDSINGTAASYITVGNNNTNDLVSQSGSGWLNDVTSSIDIPNSGFLAFAVGNAAGVAVDATHKLIKIANADGALAAAVQVTLLGSTT